MTSRDDDAFVRTLLDAARGDVPPPEAAARELARLGFAGPHAIAAVSRAAADVNVGATEVAGAGKVAGAGFVKGGAAASSSLAAVTGKLAIGLVGAASIAMVGLTSMRGSAPDVPPAVDTASANVDDGKTGPAAGRSSGHVDGRTSGPGETSDDAGSREPAGYAAHAGHTAREEMVGRRVIDASSATTPTPRATAVRRARTDREPAPSLAEEVALLDRARAIATSRPRDTLALLDQHARRYPGGALREEAAILRVQILVKSGDRSAAERFARPLLDDRSIVQTASRVRAILDEER